MKFSLPSISIIWESASKTFLRFPLEILSSVIGSFSVVWLINQSGASDLQEANVFALAFIGFLGISWFFSITVLLEQLKSKSIISWPFQIAAAISIIGYYLYLNTILIEAEIEVWYQLALFFLATHLFAAYAPFIISDKVDQFWEYNKTLFLRFLISVVYSAALFIGLSVAMYALDVLLEFNIEEEFYPSLFFIIGGIFNTWFFLAGIPSKEEIPVKEIEYPTGLKVFVQYVLISLVTVYIVILYAYLIKIILQWELPNGWVSNLVLSFSIAGILSLLLLHPINEEGGRKWIQLFSKWYYRALIPLLILLFFSIWVRISEYGVTINRFFVATLGVWLTFTVAYFVLSKMKSIKVIPISLTVFVLFSAVGPFSAFNVSERSQVGRLADLIEQNGIQVSNPISLDESSVPDSSIIEIQSIVAYLFDNHGIQSFNQIFADEQMLALSDTTDAKRMILEDFLGVPYGSGFFDNGLIRGQNYSYRLDSNTPLSIDEYEYYFGKFDFYSKNQWHSITIEEYEYTLRFINDDLHFVFSTDNEELVIPIYDELLELHRNNRSDWYTSNWEPSQMMIKFSDNNMEIGLLINYVTGGTGVKETVSNINIQVFTN